MSKTELEQVGIFERLVKRELKQKEGAVLLNLSVRQVKRKVKEYRKSGAISLIHGNRGQSGNRATNKEKAESAVRLVKENYSDFGPTFASEKLEENHGIIINHETLRKLMIKEDVWIPKVTKTIVKHFWRERKGCFGEMVQLDGSPHHWFEDRADPCTLIAFIDDATSQVLWLEFTESESTESLMKSTKSYIEEFGRPASFYADRGVVYKVNHNNPDNDKITQYKRALDELHIRLIHARSPEAKGRVENLFGTLQDRLVKELRLANVSSIEQANRFVREIYLPKHNARFAVKPKSKTDLHRSIDGYDLKNILCLKEERQINNDFTLSYKGKWLQLTEKQATIVRPRNKVEIHEHLDKTIEIFLRKTKLDFKELPQKPEKQKMIASIKILKERKIWKPSANHPWRKHYKRDISIVRTR
jgi:hypothetical protein